MHPYKAGPCSIRKQPCFGSLFDFLPPALKTIPSGFGIGVCRKVVVEIEPSVESWRQLTAIENDSADKCRGIVIGAFKHFGNGYMRRKQWYTEVGHAVDAWILTGQNACMRCVCNWAGSKCILELVPVVSQRIESGSLDVSISVTADVVRANGVNRDEKNIGLFGASRNRGRHHKETT